jgi:hypothetical protein
MTATPAAVVVENRAVADVCDRHSSARAFTEWQRVDDGETLTLTLCAHCAHDHDVPLVERGFVLTVDDRDSLDPENLIDRKARP